MIAKTHQYTPNCGAAAAIEREGSGLSWEVEQFKVVALPTARWNWLARSPNRPGAADDRRSQYLTRNLHSADIPPSAIA